MVVLRQHNISSSQQLVWVSQESGPTRRGAQRGAEAAYVASSRRSDSMIAGRRVGAITRPSRGDDWRGNDARHAITTAHHVVWDGSPAGHSRSRSADLLPVSIPHFRRHQRSLSIHLLSTIWSTLPGVNSWDKAAIFIVQFIHRWQEYRAFVALPHSTSPS